MGAGCQDYLAGYNTSSIVLKSDRKLLFCTNFKISYMTDTRPMFFTQPNKMVIRISIAYRAQPQATVAMSDGGVGVGWGW